jgi:hypothetical protein
LPVVTLSRAITAAPVARAALSPPAGVCHVVSITDTAKVTYDWFEAWEDLGQQIKRD